MALGAYSIVRYANDLNDQRVNLGVLLWHPLDGVRHRMTPFLDRTHAVDPRVKTSAVKQQIDAILATLQDDVATTGAAGFKRMAARFRSGVAVTSPYPTEMFDVDAMLERLYSDLVSPVDEIRRASTQKHYERSLKTGLTNALHRLAPDVTVEDRGIQKIDGLRVPIGVRIAGPRLKALWRAVSLQSEQRPDDQIAKAKAAALDIVTIRQRVTELKHDQQFVAVQPPKVHASERLHESIAWLGGQADKVFVLQSGDSFTRDLESALGTILPQHRTPARR